MRVQLLGGLALLIACNATPEPDPRPVAHPPDPDATRVEVVHLRGSDATLTLSLPGEITGAEDALLATASGGLVEQVFVDQGDVVGKGDALVAVDKDIYAAQVAQADAQLAQAKSDLQRLDALGDLAFDAQLTGARTQVAVAEAQLRIARTQLARAVVRAPFAGTVGGVAVEVGEYASPGSPVVRLVQLDPIVVQLSVSDRDVVALTKGSPARVRTAARADTRTGTVSAIAPVADESTRTFMVEVEVPNPEQDLLPGMIATVDIDRIVADQQVVLPQDWIVTQLDNYGVFVVSEGVASWREVTLGDVVRGQIVVTDGLELGERVVVTGQHGLVDGDRLLVAREGWCCEQGRAVFDASTAAR